jgi:hypothetical protein
MAIDNEHAIGHAGGIRADNEHECYQYNGDNVVLEPYEHDAGLL